MKGRARRVVAMACRSGSMVGVPLRRVWPVAQLGEMKLVGVRKSTVLNSDVARK